MAVAPVGFTSGCTAAGCAAVQPTACPPFGSRLLARQAVPPLRATPGRQSQALRLSRVPFHRVDPGFRERPHGWGEGRLLRWPAPRRDDHPLQPALRRCGRPEMQQKGEFWHFWHRCRSPATASQARIPGLSSWYIKPSVGQPASGTKLILAQVPLRRPKRTFPDLS